MDRGAWQTMVHGVAKSQTCLNDLAAAAQQPLWTFPAVIWSPKHLSNLPGGFVGWGKFHFPGECLLEILFYSVNI